MDPQISLVSLFPIWFLFERSGHNAGFLFLPIISPFPNTGIYCLKLILAANKHSHIHCPISKCLARVVPFMQGEQCSLRLFPLMNNIFFYSAQIFLYFFLIDLKKKVALLSSDSSRSQHPEFWLVIPVRRINWWSWVSAAILFLL